MVRARGRLRSDRPPPTSLALALIDEYVKFPPRWRPEGTRPRALVHGLTLPAGGVRLAPLSDDAIDAFIGSLRHGDPIAALEAEHRAETKADERARRRR